MPSIKSILIFLLLAPNLGFAFTSRRPEISPLTNFQREIPVQLFSGTEVTVGIRGKAALECYRGVKLSEVYYYSHDIILRFKENGIEVYDENGLVTLGLAEVRCKPRNESSIVVFGGNGYRGYLKGIYSDSQGGIVIVNMVDIDEYIMGVLPAEIGERSDDEYEAAKSQAVAARSYAVWKLITNGSSARLFPTVADQVYKGIDSEIEILSEAVLETAGEIMVFDGFPVAAYYHAVCGGHTIPIEEAWPDKEPLRFLVGANDRDYCVWAKTYSWSEVFSSYILKENLKKYFKGDESTKESDFKEIIDIEFIIDEGSGRVYMMNVFTETGVYTAERDQIRWALGRPSVRDAILPSTKFICEKRRANGRLQEIRLIGTGNGHGVGACQCGIIGRARAGQKYREILKKYYKGVEFVRIY